MFLRRGKKERRRASTGEEPPKGCPGPRRAPPEGVPLAGHPGDLWQILQAVAREEDPRFAEKSVVEHFNGCAEGQRDVARWLAIYQRRLDPAHSFSFPPHHRRHRGYALLPRNWPSGVLWEAFDLATWFKAPVPAAETEERLIEAVDAFLGASGRGEPGG